MNLFAKTQVEIQYSLIKIMMAVILRFAFDINVTLKDHAF